MPYPEVDVALRAALDRLSGLHLVGVLNTIGVRRDAEAASRLEELLESNDLAVADAAAAALGRIGTPQAAHILERALKEASAERRLSLADANLTCGERLMSARKWNAARDVFDLAARAEVPRHVKVAATRGAILARRDGGVRMLVETIQSEDESLMLLGIQVAREVEGVRATRALARLLPDLPPPRQALLVTALGDRGDLAALDAVARLAEEGVTEVRVAALHALVRLPAASVIPVLVRAGLDPDPRVSQAAQSALFDLPEGRTDRMLAARLESSDSAGRLLIIDVLARRRSSQAQEELLALTAHEDPTTRVAALKALGSVLTPAGWPTLVACLVQASTPEERKAADSALEAACARFDDKHACSGSLATALSAADDETQIMLLRRLGQAGGPLALDAVREHTVAGTPEALRDTAIRVITEWPGVEALPDLQAMVEPAEAGKALYRTLAFRGYVRLVRDSELPPETRLRHLKLAMALSMDGQEKRLILGALGSVAEVEALEMASSQLLESELSTEAGSAVLQICSILDAAHHRSAMEAALEAVVEKVEDQATVRQARQRLRELSRR
jgi:HEAT repeat protein